jgi:hypothetical protein
MVSDLLLQIGAVCIPLGVLISMFAYQFFDGWAKIVFSILGIIVFIFGGWAFYKVIDLAKIEISKIADDKKEREHKENIDNEKFIILIKEIRLLRNGGKKDGESKPDTNTQTPDSNLKK